MLLTAPLPFDEAIASSAVRTLLPTELRTKDFAALKPEILARARFSAAIQQAGILERGNEVILKLAAGETDRATARLAMRDIAIELGYQPPEGEAGTLADFRTKGRINLFLDTNVEMMTGAGAHLANQGAATRDQFPAAELYRARDAKEPRDWETRWLDAAAEVGDEAAAAALQEHGVMVARTDSRIWYAISRFGQPHEPFDFGSGMRKRLVDRDTAIELGVIDRDTIPAADDLEINQDLQATPQVRSESLKAALEEELEGTAEFVGGVLRFIGA